MPLARGSAPGAAVAGQAIHDRMTRLFPICRSITGEGLRETLRQLATEVPLEIVETPSGSRVFDWVAPPEWSIRAAWIEDAEGHRIVDFADSNLHVLNYSAPVDATVSLHELREHVYTHATDPDAVPYRTSYYEERWGFCMPQRQLEALEPGDYRVMVDSTLAPGAVSYGEAVIPGESGLEVLLTSYACHPSLANDNLSGVSLLAELGLALAAQSTLRYTYRLLWGGGTIAPLCWLARNRDRVDRIANGMVVSCLGDPGPLTYKRSRRGDAEIDQAAAHVLAARGPGNRTLDWKPSGGDERQFCSPGFDLPFGAFSRTPADAFPEYHSSRDTLDFVRPEQLGDSFEAILDVLDVLETNETYLNRAPWGEPQLGRRGLYRGVGGGSSEELGMLWVLSLSEGDTNLLEIADRAGLPFAQVRDAAEKLAAHGLIESTTGRSAT